MKIMTNKDYCMRAISIDGSVKLWVARTTDLCETARKNHDCWSVAAARYLYPSAVFQAVKKRQTPKSLLFYQFQNNVGIAVSIFQSINCLHADFDTQTLMITLGVHVKRN